MAGAAPRPLPFPVQSGPFAQGSAPSVAAHERHGDDHIDQGGGPEKSVGQETARRQAHRCAGTQHGVAPPAVCEHARRQGCQQL